jgi:hypothetical protein
MSYYTTFLVRRKRSHAGFSRSLGAVSRLIAETVNAQKGELSLSLSAAAKVILLVQK